MRADVGAEADRLAVLGRGLRPTSSRSQLPLSDALGLAQVDELVRLGGGDLGDVVDLDGLDVGEAAAACPGG